MRKNELIDKKFIIKKLKNKLIEKKTIIFFFNWGKNIIKKLI